jgi:L-ascorbate 6-phosphate lactonase
MSHPILSQPDASSSEISVCWLGNLSWLIRAGEQLVAFDLDLDHDLRLRPSPINTEEIAPSLDVLFVTHEHGDHFNAVTGAVLAERSRCLFVVPASCEAKARRIGVPEDRLRIARPREPFDLPGIRVEPLRALHGDRHQAVYRHANLDDCGYVLTLAGRRLLQPGDSVLLQDHLDLKDIDILFVSPTDHNMAIERSVLLIKALKPRIILPQHFGTYRQTEENAFWTRGYPDELRAALPAAMQTVYHKLQQGEAYPVVFPE